MESILASGLIHSLLEGATQKKPKILNAGKLTIHDNQFSFADGFLQISNLASVEVAKTPQATILIPIALVIANIVAINELFKRYSNLKVLAVVGLFICVTWLVYDITVRIRTKFGLFLAPSSGAIFIFVSSNIVFLRETKDAISEYLAGNDGRFNNCTFDFSVGKLFDIETVNGPVGGNVSNYINKHNEENHYDM